MTQADEINAAQQGRGRQADAPTQIPLAGWKDVLWRVYRSIAQDRVLLTAAGVTFYMLLALVPALTAIVAIYGLFNDRASVIDHVELLIGVVPPGALEIIRDQLTRLTAESNDTLGIAALLSLALALWSASAGVKAMFDAMNVAYKEEERRNFFAFNGTALLFAFCGALSAVLVLAVVIVMPQVIAFLPGGDALGWTVRVAAYAMMLVILSGAIAALYRWGPSRQQAKWRWITPGTILSVLALGLVSIVFSWYVSNFSDDSATYGSLGAVIGLMTWLWISTTLVIIGAELNSEIEHQTAQDSTTGEEQPLGERGAYMADSVGRAWPPDRKKVEKPLPEDRTARRFSLGALAFALPAAAVLHMVQRRQK